MRIPSSFNAIAMTVSSFLVLAFATGSAFGASYSVGGSVSGLNSGDSVVLVDNGGDAQRVTANGKFTFSLKLLKGKSYDVTVHTQPKGQLCNVTKGTGTIASADVTNVDVACKNAYLIGGAVTGLDLKEKLTLLDNGGDALTVGNGAGSSKPIAFTFTTPVAIGTTYNVTVGAPPAGQVCTVAKGTGTVGSANVSTVAVACIKGYTVGGAVTGLTKSKSLTLLDNGGNALTVSGSISGAANFAFTDALANKAKYAVTVGTQPPGETCAVTSHGTGTIASANVSNVAVSCKLNPLTIGGKIEGLEKSDRLTLLDNGGNSLIVLGTGASINFKFSAGIASGGKYDVTVGTQPAGQVCSVSGGAGTVGTSDVTGVVVTCATGYSIGGTVSGLDLGATLVLLNNGGDATTIRGTGPGGKVGFTFSAKLPSKAAFNVTVGTQPTGETCKVNNPKGTLGTANVTDISVTCSAAATTYSIGVSVSGLTTGQSVTLFDNGTDSLPVSSNGSFNFPTKLAAGAPYSVTVGTQPTAETCNVTGGKGNVGNASVVGIAVVCTPNTYSIGVSVSGLTTGQSVTLLDNGTDSLPVSSNGSFNFPTKLAAGAPYNVTVGTQPTAEACNVTGGKGNVGNANVVGIAVVCTPNPTYTVGGSVSGLTSGQSVVLQNNGGSNTTVAFPATSFTFTNIANNASYKVAVLTPPSGDTCTVTGGSNGDGSGTVAGANVTGIAVSCTRTVVSQYTIGGNISGITSGTVTLLDNGGDSLTQGNGAFTFATKLANGATYAVTVGTAPSGQTCTVTGGSNGDGSGTVAAANVTSIAVVCTKSSGGGGGNAYWIPYALQAISGETPAGSQGLELVAGDKLASNPTPQVVTKDAVQILGTGGQLSVSSGVATLSLETLMYADTNSSGVTKIYGLNLKGTSTVPTPTQIGSLSIPSGQRVCDANPAQGDYSQPDSLFVVIHVGTLLQCIGSAGTFELVNYQDSSTTAPTAVGFTTTIFDTVYQSGKLADLLVFDSSAKALDSYAYSGGAPATSPTAVITGLTDAQYVGGGYDIATISTAEAFFSVTTTGATNYLYRIDGSSLAATQIQNLGQSTVGPAVTDDTNLYYVVSTAGAASSQTDAFYQVALAGGTPTLLYTTPSFVFAGASGLANYRLIGSNDSVLAFEYDTDTYTNGVEDLTKASATLYSVPVGTTTTTPTTLASYPAGTGVGNTITYAFLAAPSGSGISGDILFATVETATAPTAQATTDTYAYEAVSIPLNGGAAPKPIANSVYAPLEFVSLSLSDSVFQVTGITDTNGGFGGGTANVADVGTLADTPFTKPGGGNYVFPVGFSGYLIGFTGNGVAEGTFGNGSLIANGTTTTIMESPVAADLSSNVLWTGTALSNTLVLAY